MILMVVLGAMLVVGVVFAVRWSGVTYSPWDHADPERPSLGSAALAYGRGAAIVLVAGTSVGVFVTGPAIRLIMRLLAVTGGDDAQGRITDADEVVGDISVGGTIGLIIFGGILTGLLSAAAYVVFRRILPAGALAGLTFGVLHLFVFATRTDPLRPDNPDFDLVGPGWLSVVTFGAAALVHGVAVVSFANRYSRLLPTSFASTLPVKQLVLRLLPVLACSLFLVFAAFPLLAGFVLVLLGTRVRPLVHALRSTTAVTVGRVAVVLIALVLLPGAVADLVDIVDRPDDVALAPE